MIGMGYVDRPSDANVILSFALSLSKGVANLLSKIRFFGFGNQPSEWRDLEDRAGNIRPPVTIAHANGYPVCAGIAGVDMFKSTDVEVNLRQ
jgi:hypothetical protein